MNNLAVHIIKKEFSKNKINVIKILLFGSRATGKAHKDSDWDFLILIDNELDFLSRWEIVKKIKRKLAVKRIPNDIIVKSAKRFEEEKNDTGSIIYYVNKQAIEI